MKYSIFLSVILAILIHFSPGAKAQVTTLKPESMGADMANNRRVEFVKI